MKREKLYLMHILEAAKRLDGYLKGDKKKFLDDAMTQDAVIKVLANLTESTIKISDATKQHYPDIPWAEIKAFRNVLAHEYLGNLEYEEIWNISQKDIPPLIEVIKTILKEKYD